MSTATQAAPSEASNDFSFLYGRWKIQHRKLQTPHSGAPQQWLEFESNSICLPVLDGIANIEEMRDAKGELMGSAINTFDLTQQRWASYWISARDGVLTPPVYGRFVGDVGTFLGPDTFNGQAILVRQVWTKVSSGRAIWEQSSSSDEGKTWELNWTMQFERVSARATLPW